MDDDAAIESEQAVREQELVDRVVASFADTSGERLRVLLSELVEALHGFVRSVRLTETEWNAGIDFLTRVGRITGPTRQEFVLLSTYSASPGRPSRSATKQSVGRPRPQSSARSS